MISKTWLGDTEIQMLLTAFPKDPYMKNNLKL